jgi:HlyD family secretion protein
VQQAQLAQAKANVHQAQTNLDYTTIESPTDGTVISRSVDVGQTVAASLSAPTLFTIAQDLTKMQVDTSVAESDVGKLQPNMPAIFTVDAYPNERFHGKVRQIRNAAQTVQNVVTYDAVIDVDNKELKLKPGMTANVTFVWAEKSDVLKVPNAAMRFKPPEVANAAASPSGTASAAVRPPGGGPGGAHKHEHGQSDKRQIWVLRNQVAAQVPIRVGISDGSVTEIVEGDVHEGEQVITDLANPGSAPKPAANGPGGGRPTGFGRF